MSLQPVPPISRREIEVRGVEPVQRRLLTPEEREQARREREQAREKRKKREEAQGQVAPGHADYLG